MASENHSGATRIPEIAGALQLLFILRFMVALLLVVAGVACLHFGGQMLTASMASTAQTVLFEIQGQMRVTAGGFGAVVMTTSLAPFFLAYLSRPTLELVPLGNGNYRIRVGARHFGRARLTDAININNGDRTAAPADGSAARADGEVACDNTYQPVTATVAAPVPSLAPA